MKLKPWPLAAYTITDTDPPRTICLQGRDRWALEMLMKAGELGLTSIQLSGPRVSAYIHDLRHEHRLNIHTETEPHEGDFPGWHGRYFLLSKVSRKQGGAE